MTDAMTRPDTDTSMGRRLAALDMLEVAARRAVEKPCASMDRVLSLMIRTALRHGVPWEDVESMTGMPRDDAERCMSRWPGDVW